MFCFLASILSSGNYSTPPGSPKFVSRSRSHNMLSRPCIISICLLEAMNLIPSQPRRRLTASGEQIYPGSCSVRLWRSRGNICVETDRRKQKMMGKHQMNGCQARFSFLVQASLGRQSPDITAPAPLFSLGKHS